MSGTITVYHTIARLRTSSHFVRKHFPFPIFSSTKEGNHGEMELYSLKSISENTQEPEVIELIDEVITRERLIVKTALLEHLGIKCPLHEQELSSYGYLTPMSHFNIGNHDEFGKTIC